MLRGVIKNDGNEDWYDLKRKSLDVASEVCGYSKGKSRHFEMWWWIKYVDVAVCRKSYLGFGNRVRMRKIGRNIMWQKNAYGSESSKGSSVRYLESGVVKVSVDD